MKHNETSEPCSTHVIYEKYKVSISDAKRKTSLSETQDLRRDNTEIGIKNGVWGLKLLPLAVDGIQ